MGITGEHREDVEEVQESLERKVMGESFLDVKSALDNVLPFMLLLLGFIILFNFLLPVTPRMEQWIVYGNWVVLIYFAIRVGVEFKLASSDREFVRQHWLDLLMLVPVFSLFREVRMARALEQVGLLSASEDIMTGSATFRSTGLAARLTKISRMIKRSVGF